MTMDPNKLHLIIIDKLLHPKANDLNAYKAILQIIKQLHMIFHSKFVLELVSIYHYLVNRVRCLIYLIFIGDYDIIYIVHINNILLIYPEANYFNAYTRLY